MDLNVKAFQPLQTFQPLNVTSERPSFVSIDDPLYNGIAKFARAPPHSANDYEHHEVEDCELQDYEKDVQQDDKEKREEKPKSDQQGERRFTVGRVVFCWEL